MPATANIGLKISVMRRESNLAGHLRWFEYLSSPEFVADWYKSVGRPGFLEELVKSARQIVDTDIYDRYTGPETGNIKASFKGEKRSSDQRLSLLVYSDPSVATAKDPYQNFSYAAFFEEPAFKSFLPPDDDPHDVRKFRPFFFTMCLEQSRLSNEGVVQRLFAIIRKHMPRKGQEE